MQMFFLFHNSECQKNIHKAIFIMWKLIIENSFSIFPSVDKSNFYPEEVVISMLCFQNVFVASATEKDWMAVRGYWKSRVWALASILPNCITWKEYTIWTLSFWIPLDVGINQIFSHFSNSEIGNKMLELKIIVGK